jgi:hypothetical protein
MANRRTKRRVIKGVGTERYAMRRLTLILLRENTYGRQAGLQALKTSSNQLLMGRNRRILATGPVVAASARIQRKLPEFVRIETEPI